MSDALNTSNVETLTASNADLQQRLQAQRQRQQQGQTQAPVDPQGDAAKATKSRRSRTNTGQRWMRFVHVYMSMIAFVVILFFGATGLLLNHPSWLGGDELTTTRLEGTLPESVVTEDGRIEFLAVSEYLRNEVGVAGEVTNFDQIGSEGSINYTGPGYGASARFDVTTLEYDVTVRAEGLVNAMRDLHSGSDTGSAWSLIIDVSAVFLVFVAISGLGIQMLMRKRRQKALAWLAVGTVVTTVLIWVTLI